MTSKWHGGKGSKPRPIEDRKQFESNWDKIFNKKPEKADEKQRKPAPKGIKTVAEE